MYVDLDLLDCEGMPICDALTAAARALVALCDDQLRHVDIDDLTEPWASAWEACEPFRRPVPDTPPAGVTDEEPW